MVFLCVRVQSQNSPYMEAIVNAEFGSTVSSDSVVYSVAQWAQIIIGQNQKADGTVENDTPFDGRISGVNIWFGVLDQLTIGNWYNEGLKYHVPNIIKWPELGLSSKRFGVVHFVKVTSAGRRKLNCNFISSLWALLNWV